MSKKLSYDRVFMQNAMKTLATNIHFASVDNPVKVLAITSSVPNEGKSTISIELSRALASGGKRVLLIDGDMRRRSLAGMLEAHSSHGIYAVLSGEVDHADAVMETGQENMFFLDCEPGIPNPVDIISSRRFRALIDDLRRSFDYVIFDTPPLSTFVDASIFASLSDGTILVIRQNYVKRDDLAAAYQQLEKAKANVIGAAMSFCDVNRTDYYYRYYAHGGGRGSEERGEAPVARTATRRSWRNWLRRLARNAENDPPILSECSIEEEAPSDPSDTA